MSEKNVVFALAAAFAVAGSASGSIVDDFNRPDGSDMGPNWLERVGDWRIENNMARSSPEFAADLMTFTGFSGMDVTISADVHYLGGARVTYASLVAGYADLGNNVFIKVQDNNSNGDFERVFFYYGNNGGPWPGMTGGDFFVDVDPFTDANISITLVGDQVTLEIDRDFNGTPEDVLTRGNIPLDGLGDLVGLAGFNNAAIDNFAIPAPSVLALLAAAGLWRRRRRA